MHFKTLVTVTMPTVEEDPHENAAVVQSIELLQAQKDELAKNLMAEITLCSLMGRTTNFARQLVSALEEVMTECGNLAYGPCADVLFRFQLCVVYHGIAHT